MEKYYGHAVIRHPEGYHYLAVYLDEERTLGNSKIMCSWTSVGDIIEQGESK